MSNFSVYKLPFNISGAKYSVVPQNVFQTSSLKFDHPKSAIL